MNSGRFSMFGASDFFIFPALPGDFLKGALFNRFRRSSTSLDSSSSSRPWGSYSFPSKMD